MNILLIGEESAGIQMLHEIERSGHRVIAVMASPGRVAASGASLWDAAAKLGLPTWPAQLVKDPLLAERMRAEEVDLLLNVHSLYVIQGRSSEHHESARLTFTPVRCPAMRASMPSAG